MINIDPKYMARAIELAAHGCGNTSPNPMVGAVIVNPQGVIIGEGYHRCYGKGHAEVNAIASVQDREALRQSTMYVTLEPCSHYGKTPPCAKLIIDTGIPRVVVGAADPFKEVAGRGIAMLRDAGVEVAEGIMADECRSLNAHFMTAHELHRPFITLKWAQSADGYMDSDRLDGRPAQFSTPLSQLIVHRLRAHHDAIAVGSETVLADNPRLDCRVWPGRSPKPIIFDRRRRIDPTKLNMPITPSILSDYDSIKDAVTSLYKSGITSLIVEGGAKLLQSFIDCGIWDVAQVETNPLRLEQHGRVKAPKIYMQPLESYNIDGNHIRIYSQNSLFSVKNP